MSRLDVHYSSKSPEWSTPQEFFDELDREFHFTLDPCCTEGNAKCELHFTEADDGLALSWHGETVFMNPPYGREISKWVAKAYDEAKAGAVVVCLLPARTDTAWWHAFCAKGEIRFVRGRLKFGEATTSAPFPSAVVIFRSERDPARIDPATPDGFMRQFRAAGVAA